MDPKAPPISVVIITKNEAQRIADCLICVAGLADEIVVLDSGSCDGTQEICASHGAHIFTSEWLGFGPQKDMAVRAARNDWVLCLDADECVSVELASSIRSELSAPAYSAYRFARSTRFLGRYLRHGEGYPDWSLRLFDRRFARWSSDAVHEKVICHERIGQLRGDLLHNTADTLESYLTKQNSYSSLAAKSYTGRPVSSVRLIFSPLVRFIKFYFIRGGMLDGIPGLVHIVIGCFNSFIKYAKILERQISKPP